MKKKTLIIQKKMSNNKLCPNLKKRGSCKICDGKITGCKHHKRGYICKQCKLEGIGGEGLCYHFRERYRCTQCVKEGKQRKGVCIHNKQRSHCIKCKNITSTAVDISPEVIDLPNFPSDSQDMFFWNYNDNSMYNDVDAFTHQDFY